MWLFTRYGFYSISVRGYSVQFRARVKAHLQALKLRFPWLVGRIVISPGTDYRYRLEMSTGERDRILLDLANEQDWQDFKGEVKRFAPQDKMYLDALVSVWSVMHAFQWRMLPRIKK